MKSVKLLLVLSILCRLKKKKKKQKKKKQQKKKTCHAAIDLFSIGLGFQI